LVSFTASASPTALAAAVQRSYSAASFSLVLYSRKRATQFARCTLAAAAAGLLLQPQHQLCALAPICFG